MTSKVNSSRLQHIISIVLIFVVAGMLAWLSNRYVLNADWTANNRNTLTPASKKLLKSMPDPITIRAFVYPDNQIREEIELRLDPYKRVKENISLEFIDPAKNPQLARELDVAASGEVFIEYQGRRESLRALSEQTITTALQRLAYSGERVVRFLSGHGERNIEGEGQSDYKLFADQLREKGLRVESLNLAKTLKVPEDTSALVIASPRRSLLEGEVKIIREYVQNGGNLLWLSDPENVNGLAGLEPLVEDVDIEWQNGTVLYPDFQMLGTAHPAILLVTEYPEHPITQDLFDITLFPFAGALKGIRESAWQQKPFLTSRELAWLETGPLEGELDFNEEHGDQAGPFMVGIAMQRNAPDAQDETDATPEADDSEEALLEKLEADKNKKTGKQRVVVVADGDFIANGFVNNLGNLQLGLNILQWLSNRDEQISVHIPPAPDNKLFLAPWAPTLFGLLFVVGMPVLLIAIGVSRWWLRRRR